MHTERPIMSASIATMAELSETVDLNQCDENTSLSWSFRRSTGAHLYDLEESSPRIKVWLYAATVKIVAPPTRPLL